MRIISGKYKGKRLIAPKKLPVRPTTDFAKESLFNILNNHYFFDEISVLDLFSGTGNISFEFASRGCENIHSVDITSSCIQFINKIAKELHFPIKITKADVFKFLEHYTQKSTVIFADPPYDMEQNQFEQLVKLIFSNNLITDNGMLIVEHSKHTDLDHLPNFSSQRKYGGNVFSFFKTNT